MHGRKFPGIEIRFDDERFWNNWEITLRESKKREVKPISAAYDQELNIGGFIAQKYHHKHLWKSMFEPPSWTNQPVNKPQPQ